MFELTHNRPEEEHCVSLKACVSHEQKLLQWDITSPLLSLLLSLIPHRKLFIYICNIAVEKSVTNQKFEWQNKQLEKT